jgi:glycine C-acetyltransferase
MSDYRSLTLADFFGGHEDDPLRVPDEFAAWRAATAREQSLYQRPLAGAPGPRTLVMVDGKPREVINLASLEYMGLNRHPDVLAAMKAALDEWGTGSCGAPMLTGTTTLYKQLEARLSRHFGREATMLFPSGFSGGLGLMTAFLRPGDVAIVDERVHLCLMDGIRQSGAQLVTFPHADLAALDGWLARTRGARRVVAVDALYSMDGDLADLPGLLDVTEAHGVGLIVDEAHSMFALGERGGGVTELQGVVDRVRVVYGTFSKALSLLGGYASGSADLVEYGRLYAHSFAFSVALPPAVVAGALAGLGVWEREGPETRRRLADNARYFREGLKSLGLDTGASTSHVIPIVLGRARALLYEAGLAMIERGLYIVPIDFPAVPEHAVRFRASLSAAHTRRDLDEALTIIEDCVARPLRAR